MPQIVKLCKEHAEYEGANYEPKNKTELLSKFLFEQNFGLKCLVVEQADSIVGYATFMRQFSTWDASFYIYLDCLFLKECIRGKGLGVFVMNEIIKYAELENCEILQWQTPDFNTNAIGFYQKIGGVSVSKERFCLNIQDRKTSI